MMRWCWDRSFQRRVIRVCFNDRPDRTSSISSRACSIVRSAVTIATLGTYNRCSRTRCSAVQRSPRSVECERGQDEGIALDWVVAQARAHIAMGERCPAPYQRSPVRVKLYCRGVKERTHLEDLKICFEDDLYGQRGNCNIYHL